METSPHFNNRKLKAIASIALIVAFIGLIDTTFLTAEHYLGGTLPCSFIKGCQIVTTSEYSVMFGLPIALYGALFYLAVIILSIIYLDVKKIMALKIYAALAIAGFIISLGLLAIQAFILHAYCLYCLASLLSSAILFGNALFMLKLLRSETQVGQQ